jgi:hypothetical protein
LSTLQAATLGNTNGTTTLGLARGFVYNRSYTAPGGGNLTVSAFNFTFGGTTPVAADSFRVAVYAISGGLPAGLLMQGLGTGYTTGGTKTISMSGTITAGATIVLAILLTNGSTSASHNLGAVTSQVNGCYRGTGFATLPDPYGSCSSTWGLANEYQMWVDYTQGGGGSPSPNTKLVIIRKRMTGSAPSWWLPEDKPSDDWRWK